MIPPIQIRAGIKFLSSVVSNMRPSEYSVNDIVDVYITEHIYILYRYVLHYTYIIS